MADLGGLLESAVYKLAQSDSTLWAAIGDKFKHGLPPASWAGEYVTYEFGALSNITPFDASSPTVTSVDIYINVWSTNDFMSPASTIADNIQRVFDGSRLSITGYGGLKLTRQSVVGIQEEDTKIWHIRIHYSCTAIK